MYNRMSILYGGLKIMMNNSQNMFWSDINDIKRFTENTESNKEKKAQKTSVIILAAVQLMENFIKGIKQLSAYDASSIIYSEANWIKHNNNDCFYNDKNQKVTIETGKVYYIDYGKTFKGELAYFHYGLCIGKRDGKILIIPISSGTNYFSNCYHPINNPQKNKKYRQGLSSEGFSKDCVLYINDVRFISAGRIIKEDAQIAFDILKDIQELVFQVEFPVIHTKYIQYIDKINRLEKSNQNQKELIASLKMENNHLKQIIENNIDNKQN